MIILFFEESSMKSDSYRVCFSVAQSPEVVFAAILQPNQWWSQEIEGPTNRLGAEFRYHFREVHRARFCITDLVPGERVVWHVVENTFDFVKDKTEWTGTDVIFQVHRVDGGTEVEFVHDGLVPAYECFDLCTQAWGTYITGSLKDLIETGKGHPNPIEAVVTEARRRSEQDFTVKLVVDRTPLQVFDAVNQVREWWSRDIGGATDQPGATFVFRYQDVHSSAQTITEWEPGKRVVWQVANSFLKMAENHNEWDGTRIVFDIQTHGNQTELTFTHEGLVPALDCYSDCVEGWTWFITDSLKSLLTTGKGKPEGEGT